MEETEDEWKALAVNLVPSPAIWKQDLSEPPLSMQFSGSVARGSCLPHSTNPSPGYDSKSKECNTEVHELPNGRRERC